MSFLNIVILLTISSVLAEEYHAVRSGDAGFQNSVELTFLQYNLHLFGGTTEFTVFFHDEERRNEICKHIISLQPDIVSLVEIWSKEYKYKMVECLNDYLPHFQLHETPSTEIGNGLLILSKYPLNNTQSQFREYKHLSGWDYFSEKGVLGTIITIPEIDKKFRLFTTHNQAQYTSKTYEKERTENLHLSSDFITDFYSEFEPAIYVGDLNIGLKKDYQQEYTNFIAFFDTKNGMVDSFGDKPYIMTPTVDPPHNNMAIKFDGKKYPPERDDFLMMTGHWKTVDYSVITDWKCVDGTSDCSDHYPICVKLSISA